MTRIRPTPGAWLIALAAALSIHGALLWNTHFYARPQAGKVGADGMAVAFLLASNVNPAPAAQAVKPAPQPQPRPALLEQPRVQQSQPAVSRAVATPDSIRDIAAVQAQPPTEPAPVTLHRNPAAPDAQRVNTAESAQEQQLTPGQTQGIARYDGNNGQQDTLITNYKGLVRALLERKRSYPSDAREQAQQGTVVINFTVDKSGAITEYEILSSSGFPVLDNAVKKLMHEASPLPPIPKELDILDISFNLPIAFRL